MLDRQLRIHLEGKKRAWQQGFAAALDMVARGTRDEVSHDDVTGEYPVIDPSLIEAD